MNHYETVFIATPVLSDVQTKELFSKFQGVITENGGQIVSGEEWGLKKLAYPIQKKTTGFYFLIEFEGEGSLVDILEPSTVVTNALSVSSPSKWTNTLSSTPKNVETNTNQNRSNSHGTESIRNQISESSYRRG